MVLADYRCGKHGRFEATLPTPLPDETPCPKCGQAASWSPTPLRFKIAISATRGKNDAPEHADWNFTQNLEDGQDPGDWQADRDAAAERRREQFVIDAVRGDR